MLKILRFLRIHYPKQQSSILQYFSRLGFEEILFSNAFFSFIFRSKMMQFTQLERTKLNILLKIS